MSGAAGATPMALLDPDQWDEIAPARSVWLITLADLTLLLIGFFVLIQSHEQADRAALVEGMRQGFSAQAEAKATDQLAADPMAFARARVDGFAVGGAQGDVRSVIDWARDKAQDPRMHLTLTGSTMGAGDVDRATGSATILAADRARFVAAALVKQARIDPDQITLIIAPGNRRAVTISAGFAGEQAVEDEAQK